MPVFTYEAMNNVGQPVKNEFGEWVKEIVSDGFGQDMKEALDVASFLLTKCKGG